MTAVLGATAAVVLLLSLPPAAGGSLAVLVQKTVHESCSSRVVEAPTRGTKTLRLKLPTTHVYRNTD